MLGYEDCARSVGPWTVRMRDSRHRNAAVKGRKFSWLVESTSNGHFKVGQGYAC